MGHAIALRDVYWWAGSLAQLPVGEGRGINAVGGENEVEGGWVASEALRLLKAEWGQKLE